VDASNGTVIDARVAVTGVASKPYLASASALALIDSDGSPAAIADAASHATDDVVVLEDLYASVSYRSHLAGIYVKRALENVLA
ncbi:MAG: xanthine dehydrogenase family protein subunit M, partial [Actinomycetota bacterium]|nr:xanthine dehydrogenase family protein subunit M [Actinomycetota bacterium]